MKNLKFSTQLIISFTIIIFFSLIIVVLSFKQIDKISDNLNEIYQHPFVVSNSVKEIEINVTAMRSSMKDVVLAENEEELNKYVGFVNHYDSLVQQSFKIVAKRYLGNKNDVKAAQNTYNDWHKIRSKVIALKKAGKSNEAIEIMKEAAAQVKLIQEKNLVLLEFANNKAAEIHANHLKEVRKSTLLLLTIVFMLFMLSVIFILVIILILKNQKTRIKAEGALRETNEYLENLFRYANALIIVWDTQFNITRFNPAFEALTGRKAIEVIGKSLEILFPPDLRKESLKIIKELGKGKRLETVEIGIAHVNGTRKTVLWNSASIMDVDGNKVIATIAQGQDITERKQIAENLNMTLDRLENSNKELEQFAYIASHDLQEPLRMISSYTQLLERKYKDKLDDDANEFIHYAVDGANRMQKMINDLLEYSRITTRGKELETIDTSITFGKAVSMLQLKIEDNSALITNDDLPIVKGDESQILRVFQNLIENAMKYKKKSENPKIHISCQKKNDFYEFSVKDNGIGIDMKYKDKLFIIFSRLHSSKEYPGTGIGLAICKRIIERHGGKIWFESKENEGSTFYFTIPALTLIKTVWKI